ncbi:hypothetical protein FB567DRAFT_424763, partial [Paraphoma chrysanthemicola]
ELISYSLAVFTLLAIVILLAVYDGTPSPVNGGNTPNSMVAFAATLLKISLTVPVTSCICQLTWVLLHMRFKSLHDVVTYDTTGRGP